MEKKTEVKASLLDKILAKLGVKTLEEAEQAVAEPQAKVEPKAMETQHSGRTDTDRGA